MKGLERTADFGTEAGFVAAAKRVTAMRIAKINERKLLNSQWKIGIDHESSNVSFAGVWGACCGQSPPLPDQLCEQKPNDYR